MSKLVLWREYKTIESERVRLKERWCWLKDHGGNKDEIKDIGRQLTSLTLKQAHILIDLEKQL